MRPTQCQGRHIRAPTFGDANVILCGIKGYPSVVDGDGESQSLRIIMHNENGPYRHVLSGNYSVEIDEWRIPTHRKLQAYIVSVPGVRAAVAVSKQAIGSHLVFVGTPLPSISGTVVIVRGMSGRIAGLKMP
jgi:hypothetical protein